MQHNIVVRIFYWQDKSQLVQEIWKGDTKWDTADRLQAYRGLVLLCMPGRAVVIRGRTGEILAGNLKLPAYRSGDFAYAIGHRVVYTNAKVTEQKVLLGTVSFCKFSE